MKKKYWAAFAIGLFLIGTCATSQALPLTGDFNALFGAADPDLPTNYTVNAVLKPGITQSEVFDSGNELIGYMNASYYTGIYLGTIQATPASGGGNQIIESELEALIGFFLRDSTYDAPIYLKVDGVSGSSTVGLVTMTITSTNSLTSGTWQISDTDPLNDYGMNFYAVKGSNEYSLFYVDPALNFGNWSTIHLLNSSYVAQGISHFGGIVESTATVVPEPGTVLLFGTGLAGLAAVGRRRKN